MTPLEAADQLFAALATVGGVPPFRGVGVTLAPPASAVSPPRLTRGAYGPDPTEATFQVAVVVARSMDAMDLLLRLEPLVVAAVYEHTQASVGDSSPGTWPSGGVDLPAYLIDVVFPL
jgi:hypothetical protein